MGLSFSIWTSLETIYPISPKWLQTDMIQYHCKMQFGKSIPRVVCQYIRQYQRCWARMNLSQSELTPCWYHVTNYCRCIWLLTISLNISGNISAAELGWACLSPRWPVDIIPRFIADVFDFWLSASLGNSLSSIFLISLRNIMRWLT